MSNIFDAKPADYRAATITVLHGGIDASAGLLLIVQKQPTNRGYVFENIRIADPPRLRFVAIVSLL